jgi:hypothetical protein
MHTGQSLRVKGVSVNGSSRYKSLANKHVRVPLLRDSGDGRSVTIGPFVQSGHRRMMTH